MSIRAPLTAQGVIMTGKGEGQVLRVTAEHEALFGDVVEVPERVEPGGARLLGDMFGPGRFLSRACDECDFVATIHIFDGVPFGDPPDWVVVHMPDRHLVGFEGSEVVIEVEP